MFKKQPFHFQSEAKEVKIKGEFTNWVPIPMEQYGDTFRFTKSLDPAVYQFCFIVDGKEQLGDYYDLVPNGLEVKIVKSVYQVKELKTHL